MTETEYDSIEYGIFHRSHPTEPHRIFKEESEALEWLAEWEEMSGLPDVFTLRWRGIGFWQEDK